MRHFFLKFTINHSLTGQSSDRRGGATPASASGAEGSRRHDPDTSPANARCLVKHEHLEGGIKAKQAFAARPGEEAARTKPSEVKCGRIKTLYIIIGSQRETGQPAFASSFPTQPLRRNERRRRRARTHTHTHKHTLKSRLNTLLPASVTQQNASVTAGACGVEKKGLKGASEAGVLRLQ